MTLKSYSIFGKKKKKRKKSSGTRDIVTGGVTALLGVALLSQTANAVNRI